MLKSKVLSATPKAYKRTNKQTGLQEEATLYHVVCENGKLYTCFSKRITEMIGKEVEFEETSKEYNGEIQWMMNLPKDGGGDYKPFFGAKKPFVPSFKDSREAVILQAKSMVLSYIKDISIKNAEISGIPVTIETVKKAFSELIPILNLDKLPEPPKTAPQEATGHPLAPIPHVLSEPKQAIIRIKMKNLNWRAKDLIDYAGACGIEIGYNPETDSPLIEKLTEPIGEKLINALVDAAR